MDDLLADDIKQQEQATSEAELGRQRSNPFSDRNSSRNKKQQLSEMGGDSNRGRVSIVFPFEEKMTPDAAPAAIPLKKRESKMQEKQQQTIQQTLFKSLGPETTPKESPLNGPLVPKFKPIERRKFSLDMDYKERVRNQDLKKIF